MLVHNGGNVTIINIDNSIKDQSQVGYKTENAYQTSKCKH